MTQESSISNLGSFVQGSRALVFGATGALGAASRSNSGSA